MGFETQQTTNTTKLPIHKEKIGGVEVAVWENAGEKGNTFLTFSAPQRSYKDKNDKWQQTTSMRQNDVPKAIAALQRAWEKSLEKDA
jgi:hypothetical protein